MDNRIAPSRIPALDRRDERDGEGFGVRSSGFSELQTQNFELWIAPFSHLSRFTRHGLLANQEKPQQPSASIAQGHQQELSEGEEQVGQGSLGIRIPEGHHMGPGTESDKPQRCHKNPGSAPSGEPLILCWNEPEMEENKDGKEYEWRGVHHGDQEQAVTGRKQMQAQLVKGLPERLMVLDHIDADRGQPWECESQKDAAPVDEEGGCREPVSRCWISHGVWIFLCSIDCNAVRAASRTIGSVS